MTLKQSQPLTDVLNLEKQAVELQNISYCTETVYSVFAELYSKLDSVTQQTGYICKTSP